MTPALFARTLCAAAFVCAIAISPLRAQLAQQSAVGAVQSATTSTFRAAKSWGYQLTNLDVAGLAASAYDVLVIDYSRDGADANALSAADLDRLRTKPDGSRRIVLSYLSIGEAENYRFYWNKSWDDLWFLPNFWSKPTWRARLNGDWGGNYAVRYWDPAWQAIILGDGGYLDRIVRAGFDGVWLDKVDSALEDVAAGRASARADMITFVARIAERGRAQRDGFLVVPQNGEQLLADPQFAALVDGFGKESLIVGEDGANVPNSDRLIAQRSALLKAMTAQGKPVLAVEYIGSAAIASAAAAKIASLGFIPLIASRNLDTLPGTVAASAGDGGARKSRYARGSSALWLALAGGAAFLVGLLAFMRRAR